MSQLISQRSFAPVQSASAMAPLVDGVFLGGFECSCHRHADGRRLDLLAATRHAELAAGDYARLRAAGMTACREGVPWVKIEGPGGEYDFSSIAPLVTAAREAGMQVMWDLMHFGWPDDVDVFRPSF